MYIMTASLIFITSSTKSSRNALDMSLKENLLLKQTLEQAARDLAAERDVTSTSTYDKLILQQELYVGRPFWNVF